MKSAVVFNIQRFTIHDGPGIRTEIFLKGCPLACRWCSNPESQKARIEPGVYPSRCIGEKICAACRRACPVEEGRCIRFSEGRIESIDREKCTRCMRCAPVCPSEAIRTWGQEMEEDELMQLILRDRHYYETSGGGVTISGGEPLMQAEFVCSLLERCRREKIHTCVETTLYAPRETMLSVCCLSDLIISDLKVMDSRIHREQTGVGNDLILENMKALCRENRDLILRIPVIPGINNDRQNMEATARFILDEPDNRILYLELLPFMHLGEEKCASLGRPYLMHDISVDREAFHNEIAQWVRFFEEQGIRCRTGVNK